MAKYKKTREKRWNPNSISISRRHKTPKASKYSNCNASEAKYK